MVTEFFRSIFGRAPSRLSAEEQQWRIDQKLLWQDQISVNRELNRITRWSVCITAIAALVGLGGLYFISETLKATKIQADASKIQATAAETSVKIAKESFQETVKNFQLDQRAWVGPIEIPTTNITPGTVRFNLIFMNKVGARLL